MSSAAPLSLPALLAQIAALAVLAEGSGGCPSVRTSCSGDAPPKDVNVAGDVACAIVAGDPDLAANEGDLEGGLRFSDCSAACGGAYSNCIVPGDYIKAFIAAEPPGSLNRGPDGGSFLCPGDGGTVTVRCANICEGRRTAGIDEPSARGTLSTGGYLAACSYLEAVSVHAFARLYSELVALGAPRDLLGAVRIAQRDEVRHARLTRDLARRYGAEPRRPAPPALPRRGMFEVALENAVEGCVRETYGAVIASIRAARAANPRMRAAMESIARDEREHAALSWRIAAWLDPRLPLQQRKAITRAMGDAVAELGAAADDEVTDAECRSLCGLASPAARRHAVALLEAALFGVIEQQSVRDAAMVVA